VLYLVPAGPSGTSSMVFAHAEIARIAKTGVVTDTFAFQTSPRRFFQQVRAIRARIRSFRPDLVHAHFGTITGVAAVVASDKPVIVTFRGSDLNPSPSDGPLRNVLQKALSNTAAFFASAVILVSAQLRSRLWLKTSKARVIPTGVDMQLFFPIGRREARERLGWNHTGPVILFNAGVTPRVKRLDLAERSFDLLREELPQARLHILRGTTPHTDLPLYMNASDCLLVTSDFEGSPDIVKEALACDLPIVSVDVGDVKERTNGVAGASIVGRDPRLIAAAALEILHQGTRSSGRSKISELDANHIRDEVLAVYFDVLDRRREKT
jgi:teichuronic acid biosynthesis glycosyltransferase TuaC